MRAFPLLFLPLAVAGCGAHPPALPAGSRHVVMMSGRDDHGLLANPNVLLTSGPGSGSVVGPLASGTLVDVLEVRGTQLKVSARGVTGWVDQFETLGELRLAGPPPSCVVRVGGTAYPAGTRVQVLQHGGRVVAVQLLDGSDRAFVVPVSRVVDRPPAPGRSCPDLSSGRTAAPG